LPPYIGRLSSTDLFIDIWAFDASTTKPVYRRHLPNNPKWSHGWPQDLALCSLRLVQAFGMGEDGGLARFVPIEELFAGRHFDAEIVVLCVRGYLSFKLSVGRLISIGIDTATQIVVSPNLHQSPLENGS
jgi:hypothetical protein